MHVQMVFAFFNKYYHLLSVYSAETFPVGFGSTVLPVMAGIGSLLQGGIGMSEKQEEGKAECSTIFNSVRRII